MGEAEALEVGREVGMKRGHLVRLARWVKDPKARHAAENRVGMKHQGTKMGAFVAEFMRMLPYCLQDFNLRGME